MKDVHVTRVDLVFAVHLAIAECAERFFVRDAPFYFRMVEVVIPENRVVGTEDVCIVNVIRVALFASRMVGREVKKIERYVSGNDLGYFHNIEACESRSSLYALGDLIERGAGRTGKVGHSKVALDPCRLHIRPFF